MAIEHTSKLAVFSDSQANIESETAAVDEIHFGVRNTDNALGYTIDEGASWNWESGGSVSLSGTFSNLNLVLARYILDSGGQSISDSIETIVQYQTKEYDSHNAVIIGSNWKFVAPRDGYYLIEARLTFNPKTWHITDTCEFYLYKNGTTYPTNLLADFDLRNGVGASQNMAVNGKTAIYLVKNDWISPMISQISGEAAVVYNSTKPGHYGYISITSVDIGNVMPGAKVFNNGNQAISSGTGTMAVFNLEYYDTENMHDTGTNTSRLYAPSNGYYSAGVYFTFAANSTGEREVLLYRNGITGSVFGGENKPARSVGVTTLNAIGESYFDVNDYLEFQVGQTSGGNLNLVSGSCAWMRKVSMS